MRQRQNSRRRVKATDRHEDLDPSSSPALLPSRLHELDERRS